MTDRISYLTISSGEKGCISTLRMMHGILDVFEINDGKVLAILETPIRDEEYAIEPLMEAIRQIRGVTDIEKHPMSAFELMSAAVVPKLVEAIHEALLETQPKTPDNADQYDQFVANHRSWRTVSKSIVEAAFEAVRQPLRETNR